GNRTRTCSAPSCWRISTPSGVIFTFAVSSKVVLFPSMNSISVFIPVLPDRRLGAASPSMRPDIRSRPRPKVGTLGGDVDVFAPQDIAFAADPSPAYARLRSEAPVTYDETTDHWLITRYADVDALLRDRRFGRTYLHVASHEEMGREAP